MKHGKLDDKKPETLGIKIWFPKYKQTSVLIVANPTPMTWFVIQEPINK